MVSRLRAKTTSDALAILLFATIGQLSHHGHVSATGYAEDALPFLVCWFAAFWLFRGRFVPTWLVGVTAGVAVRAVIMSHYRWNELAFWLVSLVFIGAVARWRSGNSRTWFVGDEPGSGTDALPVTAG